MKSVQIKKCGMMIMRTVRTYWSSRHIHIDAPRTHDMSNTHTYKSTETNAYLPPMAATHTILRRAIRNTQIQTHESTHKRTL